MLRQIAVYLAIVFGVAIVGQFLAALSKQAPIRIGFRSITQVISLLAIVPLPYTTNVLLSTSKTANVEDDDKDDTPQELKETAKKVWKCTDVLKQARNKLD